MTFGAKSIEQDYCHLSGKIRQANMGCQRGAQPEPDPFLETKGTLRSLLVVGSPGALMRVYGAK
jgi:hypothetical protein